MTQTGEAVFQFPPEESVVMNTVDAVSDFKGVDATELAPLYEVIDPDALERFVGAAESPVDVTFRYEGLDITVRSGNRISISESVA